MSCCLIRNGGGQGQALTRPHSSPEQSGDSIEGIYGTLKQVACISKAAGGVGLSVSNIRAAGSYIRGTNGTSNGLIPMLRVFNNTARFVNQGGGKRQGSFAVYIEVRLPGCPA